MKNLSKLIIVLIILFSTQITFAQEVEVTEDMLVGTWKIDLEFLKRQLNRLMEEEISKIEDFEEKRMTRRQIQETMDKGMEMMRGFSVEIRSDNTFEFDFPENMPSSEAEEKVGIWVLEGDEVKLGDIDREIENDKSLTIVDISESRIIFKPTKNIPEAPSLKFALIRE